MIRRTLVATSALLLLATTSCSGMREADGHFTVHAESFRFFGIAIPRDDQEAAVELQRKEFPNANIISQGSTPADWTSFWGALGNIFGFHGTSISGTTAGN